MTTNFERYFGSPEKVAHMAIFPLWNCPGFSVSHFDAGTFEEVRADFNRCFKDSEKFLEWLQEECE